LAAGVDCPGVCEREGREGCCENRGDHGSLHFDVLGFGIGGYSI
jgi:hypothetical protein